MKVHDVVVGGVVLGLGTYVAVTGHGLTPPRHLAYGPGFFPMLIGIGLMAVGALICVRAAWALRGAALVTAPDWLRSGRAALRFWIIPVAIVFYMVAVDPLGFLATATISLATIFVVNGVTVWRGLPLALALSVVINLVFASLLHVPLSWGVLEPVSGWLIW
ncbi:MAG: tripartite tricarboxylate transporter TctB family protein [Phyllobacteriaceae bacterium]|nr:tripartite tricarboxylate transporter TctB family protein [Phyllobacteriaceae bacterium]